jgi:predicted Zn-dependent protease with MMP-like domain
MRKDIILNHTTPPSNKDMQEIAELLIETLPEELNEVCDGLSIAIEDFPTEEIQQKFELETDFDLLALYIDSSDKVLILYRRPILDIWCETHDNLKGLVRHLMITELAQQLDYSAEEIESLANKTYIK